MRGSASVTVQRRGPRARRCDRGIRRPKVTCHFGQIDQAANRLAHVRINLELPAVSARLPDAGDQGAKPVPVDEGELREVQVNFATGVTELPEPGRESARHGHVELTDQNEPYDAARLLAVADLKLLAARRCHAVWHSIPRTN